MGCVQPILVVGEQSASVDPEKVKVFYAKRPDCEFDTIGYITVEGGYYSLATLLQRMRVHAAEIGADAIYVTETRRLDIFDYIGSARAIRCLSL